MVKATRIFETVLYATDLAACERFYRDAIGLRVESRSELMLALRCGDGVLLIFDPDGSEQPGRPVPSHGARGPGHVAFGVTDDELPAWRRRLEDAGVPIEREVEWDAGGRSIYVRDPGDNSVELAPPALWGGGWRWAGG